MFAGALGPVIVVSSGALDVGAAEFVTGTPSPAPFVDGPAPFLRYRAIVGPTPPTTDESTLAESSALAADELVLREAARVAAATAVMLPAAGGCACPRPLPLPDMGLMSRTMV